MWGALAGIGMGLYQDKKQRDAANEQQDFQQYMSDSSYTRAAADLENAGINKILAGQFGGASSPAGALAQMSSLSGAAQTGAHTAKTMGADTDKTEAETFLKTVEGLLKSKEVPSKEIKEKVTKQALDMLDNFMGMDEKTKTTIAETFMPLLKAIPDLFGSSQISDKQKEAFNDITKRMKNFHHTTPQGK